MSHSMASFRVLRSAVTILTLNAWKKKGAAGEQYSSRLERSWLSTVRRQDASPQEARTFSSSSLPLDEKTVNPSNKYDTDVLIVGGGPVGLTAGLLLARWGLRSIVADQRDHITRHPQAHLINHRTMEVFRAVPGLGTKIEALVPPLDQWRSFVYCDSMTGDLIGTVDHFPGQVTPHQPSLSPEPVVHLSQHKLTPLLWDAAASEERIELLAGTHVAGVREDPPERGVEAVLSSSSSSSSSQGGSQAAQRRVRARYVMAADGARGQMRRSLGIGLEGSAGLQHLINVHFISKELGRRLAGREGMLYFVFSRSTIAVVVAHNISEGEFVAQIPYFPPLQMPEGFTREVCRQLVQLAAVGPSGAQLQDLEVRTVRPWTMSGLVAETYRSRGGRAFLVGDAAHQFPPSGAFGMNTGIQDAHNLAWKLAAAIEQDNDQLLDSYTHERRPIAVANMQLSVQNFYEALKIPKLMGLDYHAAVAINDVLASPLFGWIPDSIRRTAMETGVDVGRAAVPALSTLRRREIQEVLDSGESLRLQYLREDLGFLYADAGSALYRQPADILAADRASLPQPRHSIYSPQSLLDGKSPPLLLLLLPGIDATSCGYWLHALGAYQGDPMVLPVIARTAPASEDVDDDADFADALVLELGPEAECWAQTCHALLLRPDGHIGGRWAVPMRDGSEAAVELGRAVQAVMKQRV